MLPKEDAFLQRVYRRHFYKSGDNDVGFTPASAGNISQTQAEKERSDERYALHFITKIRCYGDEAREDYETLMTMSESDLQKTVDDRMFSVNPNEPFPSRAHLRALAVGDARGITDTWRQSRSETKAEIIELRAEDKSVTKKPPVLAALIPPRHQSPLRRMIDEQNAANAINTQPRRAFSR